MSILSSGTSPLPTPSSRKKPQKMNELGLLLRMVSESSELDSIHKIFFLKSDNFLTSVSQSNLNLEIQDQTFLSTGGKTDSKVKAQAEATLSVKVCSLKGTGAFRV